MILNNPTNVSIYSPPKGQDVLRVTSESRGPPELSQAVCAHPGPLDLLGVLGSFGLGTDGPADFPQMMANPKGSLRAGLFSIRGGKTHLKLVPLPNLPRCSPF